MGMFDFVSKVGAKLGIDYFKKQEELKRLDSEAERLTQEQALRDQMSAELTTQVNGLGLQVKDLTVRVRAGGAAHLKGVALSQEAREKAIVFVGNHEGIEKVNDDELELKVPEPPGVLHQVARGDTLSLLAKRYYGIIHAYPAIAEANTQLVKDVDDIEVGWVIRVPPIASISYTVEAGDTLGTIAKKMYGEARHYTRIFEASRDVVSDPDVVKAGMVLTIPVLHPLPQATNVVA